MSDQATRTVYGYRRSLMAMLLLRVVAACGRGEPPNSLAQWTGTPHSVVATASLQIGAKKGPGESTPDPWILSAQIRKRATLP